MRCNKVDVRVEWLGEKLQNLPNSSQYSTVAKFDNDKNFLDNAWSIVLEFLVPAKSQGNPSFATARFLMKNAPHEKLSENAMFELFEGKSCVANVSVLHKDEDE